MDQGVLQCLKLKYRFTMMRHVITCVNNEENLTDVISKINLRNAIEWIADAWDNVEPITIIKSWNPLWPRDKRDTPARQNSNKESLIDSEDGALPQLFHDILKHTESEYAPISYHSVQEWLNPPSLITPEEALSNEEVLQVIIEKEDHGKMESKNINLNEERIITGTDVINYLEKILTYSLSHPNHFSNEDVDALRRINKSIMQETERRAIESSTEKF
ncbi:hypothetical protein PV325_007941 [Microctonus aethiopoides]|nr:hypothetical protein PV325_007941 [Microctonus aethiopoides]